jgi:hypothetical protein
MYPIKPRIDWGDVDGDLCHRAFERTQAKALLALLLSDQTDFV